MSNRRGAVLLAALLLGCAPSEEAHSPSDIPPRSIPLGKGPSGVKPAASEPSHGREGFALGVGVTSTEQFCRNLGRVPHRAVNCNRISVFCEAGPSLNWNDGMQALAVFCNPDQGPNDGAGKFDEQEVCALMQTG